MCHDRGNLFDTYTTSVLKSTISSPSCGFLLSANSFCRTTPVPTARPGTRTSMSPTSSSWPPDPTRLTVTPTSRPPPPTPSPSTSKFLRRRKDLLLLGVYSKRQAQTETTVKNTGSRVSSPRRGASPRELVPEGVTPFCCPSGGVCLNCAWGAEGPAFPMPTSRRP